MKIFLLSLIMSSAFASDPQSWVMGTTELKLVDGPDHSLINPSCLSNSKCDAMKAVKTKSEKLAKEMNGKNPGSRICSEKFSGTVFIARRGKTEQAFCMFKDKSILSLNGLVK